MYQAQQSQGGFQVWSHRCHSCGRPLGTLVPHAESTDKKQGPRDGIGRARYNTKRRQAQEQKDLQDLMVDPQYDPLFEGIEDEDYGDAADKDPFSDQPQKVKKGRPKGSAKLSRVSEQEDVNWSDLQSRKFQAEDDEYDPLLAYLTYEEPPPPKGPEILKRYKRWWYLQKQQEEAMELHHKFRATEISNYAQSTALAAVMERLERADEYSDDPDPLPSWIRAKKLIAENWHIMEQLGGSRKDTLEALNEYADITAERQHLLDTWDPVLFEGQPDSEEPKPDFIDRYLIPANAGEEPRKSEQSESSIMDEILPDMDIFDDEIDE